MSYVWEDFKTFEPTQFVCGYCGKDVAPATGFRTRQGQGWVGKIFICHYCTQPTFISRMGTQHPGAQFGESVSDVSDSGVLALYEEARRCMSANAYTSAVLACRKLLMHIAVSKGAEPGQTFVAYVQFLSDKGFVPPDARDWVDHIRTKGNEANHEIVTMQKEDAEELISFSSMLLKIIFEFPARIAKKKSSAA